MMAGRAASQPMRAASRPDWRRNAGLWILLLILALCALGGGASRIEVLSLLYLRPIAVLSLVALLLLPQAKRFATPVDTLIVMLACFAAAMAVQLIPLPPLWWETLPGHAQYALGADIVGAPLPWRPISLTPHLTWNSLLALLPPAAALIAMRSVDARQSETLLIALIALAVASSLVGLLQITGGPGSPAYLYTVTNRDSAVGFFANRNHQAALLAMTFPMLRLWTLLETDNAQWRRTRLWIGAALGIFLLPMVLVTGSRAGLALALIGVASAFLIDVGLGSRRRAGASRRRGWLIGAGAAAGVVGMAALVLLMGRGIAVDRLAGMSVGNEQRFQQVPLLLRMTADFFPAGSGFGSFDPVYRSYEPDEALAIQYFNHAHNDYIELVLTGGVLAGLVLLAFFIWFARAAWGAWLRPGGRSPARLRFARLGVVMIAILAASSVVDYPLRTPLHAVLFAIAAAWLAGYFATEGPQRGDM